MPPTGKPPQVLDSDDSDQEEEQPKKRRSALEVTIEQGSDAAKQCGLEYSWDGHWQSRKRRRDFDAFVARLNSPMIIQ